eukprot:3212471-Alexandrium_andersonii.AAC.1
MREGYCYVVEAKSGASQKIRAPPGPLSRGARPLAFRGGLARIRVGPPETSSSAACRSTPPTLAGALPGGPFACAASPPPTPPDDGARFR